MTLEKIAAEVLGATEYEVAVSLLMFAIWPRPWLVVNAAFILARAWGWL